jgi:hypothetical protein
MLFSDFVSDYEQHSERRAQSLPVLVRILHGRTRAKIKAIHKDHRQREGKENRCRVGGIRQGPGALAA